MSSSNSTVTASHEFNFLFQGKPPKAAGSFGGKALTVGAQFKVSVCHLPELIRNM